MVVVVFFLGIVVGFYAHTFVRPRKSQALMPSNFDDIWSPEDNKWEKYSMGFDPYKEDGEGSLFVRNPDGTVQIGGATLGAGMMKEVDDKLREYLSGQGRCCGLCDGTNDICVGDQYCDDHDVMGCEECFGPRQSTIDKLFHPHLIKEMLELTNNTKDEEE